MALPSVAIVGRPNVGKSSLFNAIARRRIAIVDPTAGVTRDRVSTLIQTAEACFELVDTGGMGIQDSDDLTPQIEAQIEAALAQSDLVLFVLDARGGTTGLDLRVAERLRGIGKPVVCVANKCDTPEFDSQAAEFFKLGFAHLYFVSALQNRGIDSLIVAITRLLPPISDAPDIEPDLKLAIVGRRNTGKSTLINSLAQCERMIVSEVAGTTRDSVDVRFERDGKRFIAIDTAGVRKKKRVKSDIEFYSMHRAERSIRRADVVLLLLDAARPISQVDKKLAEYVFVQHKPAIFVINKWDLLRPRPTGDFAEYLRKVFPNLDYVPMAFVTARDGRNVFATLNLAQHLHKQACTRVSTAELNRVLNSALEQQPPPMRENRQPRIIFGAQIATQPPTISLVTNGPELLDNTYQRYLVKFFRDHLPFRDVPIRLLLRRRKRAISETAKLETTTSVPMRTARAKSRAARPGPRPQKRTKSSSGRKPGHKPGLWRD